MNREILIIAIGRLGLDPTLIPPLQIIIETLKLISPVKIYTSMEVEIIGQNLYSNLVNHLTTQSGKCSMSNTLRKILAKEQKNFRVCILGNQRVEWDVINDYKRKKILIDTAGTHHLLQQISFVTGGVHRKVSESNMIKNFLTVFGISSKTRSIFKLENQSSIKFSLECRCCQPPKTLQQNMLACTICLAAYCPVKDTIVKCKVCGVQFKKQQQQQQQKIQQRMQQQSNMIAFSFN